MLVGNYGGGNGCMDNDDGSLMFNIHDSCHVYGHQKFKVGAIRNYDNVLAFVSDLAGSWNGVGESGYATNLISGSRVIFATAGATYHDCSWGGGLAQNSTLFGTPAIRGKTCAQDLTLPQWQALSATNDVGSTVNATIPSPNEIMGWWCVVVPWCRHTRRVHSLTPALPIRAPPGQSRKARNIKPTH